MWYQPTICLGTHNSPVNRLVLFHVINSSDYILYLFKKLKLYTKLSSERVHKAPISIQIKIYLWSCVDYQYRQKSFYNWNITLNYCSICKISIRGNFFWKYPWSGNILEILGSIRCWPERAFFGNRAPKILPLTLSQSLFSVFCIEIKLCIIFSQKEAVFDSRMQYRSRCSIMPCW